MHVKNNAFRTLYQKSHSLKWQSRRVVSWTLTLEDIRDIKSAQQLESVSANSYIQFSICSPLRRGQYISNMPLLFINFLPFLAMTPVCLGPNLLSGTRSLSSSHIFSNVKTRGSAQHFRTHSILLLSNTWLYYC